MVPDHLITFAHRLADLARGQTLRPVNAAVVAENKGRPGHFDPVTETDRMAEQAMRDCIRETYPQHGIIGEELGETVGTGRYQWLLDPIDGTRSYICGLPSWTTLIALVEDAQLVLGIIDAPVLDQRYCGCNGESWLTAGGARVPLRASNCTDLADARLSTTDPFLFRDRARDDFDRLRRSVRVTSYGHDAYAYGRLAAGSVDLVVECGLKPHDYAALVPIVRGAGGTFGDWLGGNDFAEGNVIAAATAELYDAAVAIMGRAR